MYPEEITGYLLRQFPQGVLQGLLESTTRRSFERRVGGLLRKRPMISQVHERREEILAHRRRSRWRTSLRRWCRDARQAILQLEDDPFRSLLADTRNRRETRHVAALDGSHQFKRLDARQHRQRNLRPDTTDSDQPIE